MLFPSQLPRKWFLVVVGIICLFSIAVGATVTLGINRNRSKLEGSTQSKLEVNQVKNKTSALQVISIVSATRGNSSDGAIALTVKNVLGDKSITGLVVDNGAVEMQMDFIAQDDILPPGGVYSFVVSPQLTGVSLKSSDISVLAAILNNHTYDGDAKIGQKFLDRRNGQKRELGLLVPILKNALTSQGEDIIAQVLAEIEKVPHPHTLDLPKSVMQGAHEMRERVVGKVQDYQAGKKKSKLEDIHFIGQIHQEYARILLKL